MKSICKFTAAVISVLVCTSLSFARPGDKEISIEDSFLKGGEIYFTGSMNARHLKDKLGNPMLLDRPLFNRTPSNNRKTLAGVIPKGSSGKVTRIIEVSPNRYALRVRVTEPAGTKVKGWKPLKKNQEAWVYYNPKHNHMEFSRTTKKGENLVYNLRKQIDKVKSGDLRPKFDDDFPVAPPKNAKVIHSKPKKRKKNNRFDPLTDLDVGQNMTDKNSSVISKSIDAASFSRSKTINYCGEKIVPEKFNNNECPERPTRPQLKKRGKKLVKTGKWKHCEERTPTNVNRHAKGMNYKSWVYEQVRQAAEEANVDPALMLSMINAESMFHPMSSNSWNDFGIAQFQMGTAKNTMKEMRKLAAPSSPMLKIKGGVNTQRPRGCKATSVPWKNSLSRKCFKAIKSECGSTETGLKPSLFCPQFALRLMAYHIRQIKERPIWYKGEDVQPLIMGEDPTSQARFIVSVYNRGNRIANSAIDQYKNTGKWPSAEKPTNYGKLWQAKRKGSRSLYPGGNLRGHYINRCYNWKITGLCGGVGNSLLGQYRNEMCKLKGSSYTGDDSSSDGGNR